MKRETQRIKVKRYLESGQTITPIEALEMFGCFRLAAIVHSLREKDNMNIETELVINKYGTKYAQYNLKKYVANDMLFKTLNSNDNPINDNESKAKLLLRMKKYNRVQFRTSLDNNRYIRIGYWEQISPIDIAYVHKNSRIRLDKISIWDDDCGRKYWYPII